MGGVKDLADHLLLQEGRVALLHGAAHSGKTRMAHELIAMMRSKGWNAGFLARTPRPDHDWHDVLPRLDRSTLLVVDELETRPAQWKALRKWVTDDRSGHVSLLGIARSPRQEDGTTTTQVQTSDATATPSQLTHLLKEPLRQITEGPAGCGSPTRRTLMPPSPAKGTDRRRSPSLKLGRCPRCSGGAALGPTLASPTACSWHTSTATPRKRCALACPGSTMTCAKPC